MPVKEIRVKIRDASIFLLCVEKNRKKKRINIFKKTIDSLEKRYIKDQPDFQKRDFSG